MSRAVDYSTRAGDRALAQLAHDEAAGYYRQALDLLDAERCRPTPAAPGYSSPWPRPRPGRATVLTARRSEKQPSWRGPSATATDSGRRPGAQPNRFRLWK